MRGAVRIQLKCLWSKAPPVHLFGIPSLGKLDGLPHVVGGVGLCGPIAGDDVTEVYR